MLPADKPRPLALIVDRDADARRLYSTCLRGDAYDIEETEDGREALAKALTLRPEVLVTDTRIPGIDGFDLCRLLRRDEMTRETAIVVITGDASTEHVGRARNAGADAVLVKPCLPAELTAEIRRVLSQSHELRSRARAAHQRFAAQVAKSNELIERSHANFHRVMLSRSHQRRDTTDPPSAPPAIVCPTCDLPLKYVNSYIGGVSDRFSEQWDYFECVRGCGTFQYRHRTRKLRRV